MGELSAEALGKASSLLQELIRFDTTNPPGNERACAERVGQDLKELGLTPEYAGRTAERPNVVARWVADPARRRHRPLILSCHLDVVPARPESWTHPPFSGHHDGTHIWGRGAIDMKGFAAMGLAALRHLREQHLPINRDVIFAAVVDEEAGTRDGSDWLVEHRPDLLGSDPEYVINEVGGFTVHQSGRRYYPVQVAEKGVAWLRLRIQGKPGHSSLPASESTLTELARAVDQIARTRLPWHPSPESRAYLNAFAKPRGQIARKVGALLQRPSLGPLLLPALVGDPTRRQNVEAILRNTANPTRLRGSEAINVLPGLASVDIDGRLAPGQSAEDLIAEIDRVLKQRLKRSWSWEILHESPATSFSTDTALFSEMEKSLLAADPGCHVAPAIIPGFTDSRNYARLGAQCYGFYPLRLPKDLNFAALFHGIDERIPEEGFHWGIEVLSGMLAKFLVE